MASVEPGAVSFREYGLMAGAREMAVVLVAMVVGTVVVWTLVVAVLVKLNGAKHHM